MKQVVKNKKPKSESELSKAVEEFYALNYAAHYIGERTDERGHVRDTWVCVFEVVGRGHRDPVDFRYFTGTGNRRDGYPVYPRRADVLHCLFMDSEAIDLTFEDWCDNFGEDTDSLKAQTIYRECREQTKRLIALIDRADFDRLRHLEH